MEEKNIALLGFVSQAADYLKDKIEDDGEQIKELNKADLETIKNDLSKKIGFSFDGISDKTDDLISAGREAFDDFICKSPSMIEEFADIFNVDFKKENDEKDEKVINHLLKILKEPKKKDETDELADIIFKVASSVDNKEEKEKVYKDDVQDKEIDNIFNEIIAHEAFEVLKNEENIDDDIVEEENKEEKTIEEVDKDVDRLTSSEFKKILEDVLGNVLAKINDNKEAKEESEENKKDDLPDVVDDVFFKTDSDIDLKENKEKETVIEEESKEEEIDVQSDHEAIALIKDILSKLNDNIEKEKESNDIIEPSFEKVDNDYVDMALDEEAVEDIFDDDDEIEDEVVEESNDENVEEEKTEDELSIFDDEDSNDEDNDESFVEEGIHDENIEEETDDSLEEKENVEEINDENLKEETSKDELIVVDDDNLDDENNDESFDKEEACDEEDDFAEEFVLEEDTTDSPSFIDEEETFIFNDKEDNAVENTYDEQIDFIKENDVEDSIEEIIKEDVNSVDIDRLEEDLEALQEEKIDEKDNKVEEDFEDEEYLTLSQSLKKLNKDYKENKETFEELSFEDFVDEIINEKENNNGSVSEFFKNLKDNLQKENVEETNEIDKTDKVEENDDIDSVNEEEAAFEKELIEEVPIENERTFIDDDYIEEYNNRSIDEIYIANPGLEALENNEEIVEDVVSEESVADIKEELDDDSLENEEEEKEETVEYDYLSDLIDTLNKDDFAEKIKENKRKEEELKVKVYDSIKAIYPYLSNGFIKGVYDLKEVFAKDYKEDEKIVILHRLVFEDIDGLRKFVDVMVNHNYLINADEKKMIVDVFKEHINTDGKILTDIFEVANQAKYLSGDYDGYRIIEEEEVIN